MDNFIFHNPTKIIFGKGQVDVAGTEAAKIGKKILLVTGRGSVKKSGLYDKITGLLKTAGVTMVDHTGVGANPEIDFVREGVAKCKGSGVDAILAVGGGSAIDAAKAIAAGADYEGDPWDFFDRKGSANNPLPLGVILTLSATGSEGNGNSVVSNPATKEKRPTYHPGLYPRFSILDPTLTFSVPPDQTGYGAVDIMSHIFEQYFNNTGASPIQDGYAETLMRTVIANAPVAMEHPDDYNARANIMWASTLALNGSIGAGVTGDWASHMIEHELSAKFGIAHGAGLAIVFPSWMRSVYTANVQRFVQYAVNVWGVAHDGDDEKTALAGIAATESFFRDTLKVGIRMSDYGISNPDLEDMAGSAMKHRQLGAFKPLTKNDIVEIYRRVQS